MEEAEDAVENHLSHELGQWRRHGSGKDRFKEATELAKDQRSVRERRCLASAPERSLRVAGGKESVLVRSPGRRR